MESLAPEEAASVSVPAIGFELPDAGIPLAARLSRVHEYVEARPFVVDNVMGLIAVPEQLTGSLVVATTTGSGMITIVTVESAPLHPEVPGTIVKLYDWGLLPVLPAETSSEFEVTLPESITL